MAAVLWGGNGAAASHLSAAGLYRLPVGRMDVSEVSVPRDRIGRHPGSSSIGRAHAESACPPEVKVRSPVAARLPCTASRTQCTAANRGRYRLSRPSARSKRPQDAFCLAHAVPCWTGTAAAKAPRFLGPLPRAGQPRRLLPFPIARVASRRCDRGPGRSGPRRAGQLPHREARPGASQTSSGPGNGLPARSRVRAFPGSLPPNPASIFRCSKSSEVPSGASM